VFEQEPHRNGYEQAFLWLSTLVKDEQTDCKPAGRKRQPEEPSCRETTAHSVAARLASGTVLDRVDREGGSAGGHGSSALGGLMRQVVYVASISIDGYIGSANGDDQWVVPDPELHRHFNELESSIDTHLYGRRMYELMAEYWPAADEDPSVPEYVAEYARIWRAMPKVVFSNSLERVEWNARLVRGDAAAEVSRLKRERGESMSVGGSALATSLANAGLIDEFRFYVMPTIVGEGTPAFPDLTAHLEVEPVEVRRFPSGAVLLRYRR
jgi:dihydrofolate reductase